ncbi:MAG: translation elongation factor Ts [Verrucomicrobiales bacterium]
MAEVTVEKIKQLREKTNAGMMDCKAALVEANGNMEEAETVLRKKGIAKAEKKASRAAKEGVIASYIHMEGRVGVLVEVNCETDFVAKNENFRAFVKDITLHIAAYSPVCVSREEVAAELVEKEKEIYRDQVKDKPEQVQEKIIAGKLDKFFSSVVLLEQGFVKDPDKTVGDVVKEKVAELGENLQIRRFTRYAVGEDLGDAADEEEGEE